MLELITRVGDQSQKKTYKEMLRQLPKQKMKKKTTDSFQRPQIEFFFFFLTDGVLSILRA